MLPCDITRLQWVNKQFCTRRIPFVPWNSSAWCNSTPIIFFKFFSEGKQVKGVHATLGNCPTGIASKYIENNNNNRYIIYIYIISVYVLKWIETLRLSLWWYIKRYQWHLFGLLSFKLNVPFGILCFVVLGEFSETALCWMPPVGHNLGGQQKANIGGFVLVACLI